MRGYFCISLSVFLVACGSDSTDSPNSSGGSAGNGGNSANAGSSSAGASGATSTSGGSSGTTGAGGATVGSGGSAGSAGSVPGAGGGAVEDCPAFTAGNDLAVCTATYVTGGSSDDQAGGVAISPSGAVIYAGTLGEGAVDTPSSTLLSGGAAGLLLLAPDGKSVIRSSHVGGSVTDVAVSPSSGLIAISGDFGVALLDATAEAVVFDDALGGEASQVAIGSDDTVAAFQDGTLHVFDSAGTSLGSASVSGYVNDVAVDATNELVFVAGFKQDDGAPCTQLQIPFIRAYHYDGSAAWKAYDWNHTEVGAVSECADTRGISVSIGGDGKLYYSGESHGGNTVHRRDPQDLATFADNVKSDAYNDAYNMNGAAPIGYVARFDPATGAFETGTTFLTRLSSGKGNAARPKKAVADASGNVLVVGASACCIENATERTVSGIAVMPEGTYAGGGFALVLSSDFTTRMIWTTWNGAMGGGATGIGAAAAKGAMAVVLQQNPKDGDTALDTSTQPLVTVDAIQGAPGGGTGDAFVSVWRGP